MFLRPVLFTVPSARGTPSMNVQTVLNSPPLKYPVYNALSYDSNGSGYYTISHGSIRRYIAPSMVQDRANK